MASLGGYATVDGADTGVEAYGNFSAAPTAPHVAIILLAGLAFITFLRMMGFRAMIAVGRG